MSQRFEKIKNPINFRRMMETMSSCMPIHMDDEDLVATIYGLMSMYVHDPEFAEYVLTIALDNVKEFYDKADSRDESIIHTVLKIQ